MQEIKVRQRHLINLLKCLIYLILGIINILLRITERCFLLL